MPLFIFKGILPDEPAADLMHGHCRDLAEAKGLARRLAFDFIWLQRSSGGAAKGWVRVEDEQHRPLLSVPLRWVAFEL